MGKKCKKSGIDLQSLIRDIFLCDKNNNTPKRDRNKCETASKHVFVDDCDSNDILLAIDNNIDKLLCCDNEQSGEELLLFDTDEIYDLFKSIECHDTGNVFKNIQFQ